MDSLKKQIRWTMALGVLAALAGLLCHLALTDIAHGETDAALEWNMLRLGAAVFVAFWGSPLLTLRRVLRQLSEPRTCSYSPRGAECAQRRAAITGKTLLRVHPRPRLLLRPQRLCVNFLIQL